MLRRPKAPETDEEDRARLQQQAKKFEAFLEVTKGRPLPPSQLQAAVAQMKAEGTHGNDNVL